MRNENAFNAFLSKEIRKFGPEVFAIKVSDKFTVGISDFLVFGFGKTLALETKFVRKWPGDNKLLLDHTFSGGQVTFLESMHLAGHRAYGAVAVEETRRVYFMAWNRIPESGNWKTKEFREQSFPSFPWEEVDRMLAWHLKDEWP